MSSFDGLPPGPRHTLLGVTAAKFKAARGPELEAARVQRLLADRSAGPNTDWWDAVVALLAVTLCAQPERIVDRLLLFAHELGSAVWLTTMVDVAKAILAHLGDWARLDDAGRQAAIEAQTFEALARDSEAVAEAANAHGLPAAAPDLHLPLGSGDARTDSILAAYVAAGQLIETGERRNSWRVYVQPDHGMPLAPLTSAAVAAATAILPSNPATQRFATRFRNFPLATPWFHKIWYDAMDDPANDRVFIMGPRGHAKTSCALTYALRLLSQDHHLRIGILSQTDELARRFLAEVQHELQTNDELRAHFGPHGGDLFEGYPWTGHALVLNDAREGPNGISGKDVSVFSVGRGGQITGYHCDLLIVDDLETKEGTDSPTVRQGTREWWSREVEPVVAAGGKIIATGTRKHWDDIYSYWLAPASGWTVVDVAKSVFREDGSPIWPEMWSLEALALRKSAMDQQDLLAWPQEYLNEPRPSETQMFHPKDWPQYEGDPHRLALQQSLTILQFWDLAISEKTTADFTVGWCVGVSDDNDIFILERRRGHWDFNTTLNQIADLGKAWPGVAQIGIEQVAYQAAAVQEALRRSMLPIVPVVPD